MNKKETAKMQYVKVIGEKQPVRPTELSFNRIRYDYIDELENEGKICRIKYGPGYSLLFIPGNENIAIKRYERDILKNERTFDAQKSKQRLTLPIPEIKETDEAIARIIKNESKIPTIEELGVEIGKDPKIDSIHSLIFERLAIIQRQQKTINSEVKPLFYKKVKVFQNTYGKTRKYDEDGCIPTAEELMQRLLWGKSERENPALIALLDLCINQFKAEQTI